MNMTLEQIQQFEREYNVPVIHPREYKKGFNDTDLRMHSNYIRNFLGNREIEELKLRLKRLGFRGVV